jgi:hypothetical protein
MLLGILIHWLTVFVVAKETTSLSVVAIVLILDKFVEVCCEFKLCFFTCLLKCSAFVNWVLQMLQTLGVFIIKNNKRSVKRKFGNLLVQQLLN